jgi:hypothetical protein
LQTMSAAVVTEASIALELQTNRVTASTITDDPGNAAALRAALGRLLEAHAAIGFA